MGASVLVVLFALSLASYASPASAEQVVADGGQSFEVSVSDRHPAQGDPVLIEVRIAPPPDNVTLAWKGRVFPLKVAAPGTYLGLVGIDLMDPPGKVPLSVAAVRGGSAARFDLELTVRERAFPVQELALPETMARFDDATLERIRGEAARIEALFSAVSPPAWDLPFLRPVEDFRPAGFGARRVINGEPRSPHAGADIHLPAGTPVTASAAGTVVFAGEQFFGGRSVILDHGGGVFTVYYHLQEYAVRDGQRLEKGERIGAVGSSGRATGPHLHFGVRAAGGRIDPSRLFERKFNRQE
ncbi:MAG: M23 family metallopeptidase [Deltaproteobacteria bacterium]|nr:M23 family metallopeptidase [Deltaproteobacteria bacterium]